MHKTVLKTIALQGMLSDQEVGDIKSEEHQEITIMDFVSKNRDFSRIKDKDMDAVCRQLKVRCSETWTIELETRAKELNKKFMTLKMGNPANFIDPDYMMSEAKNDEHEVERLMTTPECWSMDTRERALEFSEILHHFTIFAPFEGRPFVRAWLEALIPCFSRWILMSDSTEIKVRDTLKYFLGAFGQPGIVVCLADKGASMLEILKKAARSVEALGRGTVERHYWKRLNESFCGGGPGWQELASINNKPLTTSQLDYLPQGWLSDASDCGLILANVVSPEITKRFEKKIGMILNDSQQWVVHAGPPKTLARCQAKGREYMSEFATDQTLPRWTNFAMQFKKVFQREPKKPEDFVWNVVDLARCSITVPDAVDVIKVMRILEEQFPVICIKNGYNSKDRVKGSGYRDLKLLIEVEFNDLQLEGAPRLQQKMTVICEIQILCQAWLKNKKNTSISYKILRSQSLRSLLNDAAKYVKRTNTNELVNHKDELQIIKNGWVNLAKAADFSNINADELLLTAANQGWSVAGVQMLVKDLKADINVTDYEQATPLIWACQRGKDDIAKCLIQLRSNIEQSDSYNDTPLHWATCHGHERCVRILLSAGARIKVRNRGGKSALDYALDLVNNKWTKKSKRILKLLRGENLSLPKESDQNQVKLEELQKAALEGSLAKFLDLQDVPHSVISHFLPTNTAVSCLEHLLQTLWFGADIEQREYSYTPLFFAAKYGTPATVNVLLQASANVNVTDESGDTPLHVTARYGNYDTVKLLLGAKADLNVINEEGFIPLDYAKRYGSENMVAEILKFKA